MLEELDALDISIGKDDADDDIELTNMAEENRSSEDEEPGEAQSSSLSEEDGPAIVVVELDPR